MATKNELKNANDATKADIEATANKDSELVKIKIPVDPANRHEGDVTVGLNGKMFKIKRGIAVEVPRGVAEILEHSEIQERTALEFIDQVSSND